MDLIVQHLLNSSHPISIWHQCVERTNLDKVQDLETVDLAFTSLNNLYVQSTEILVEAIYYLIAVTNFGQSYQI